jgi:TolB-like protein
MAITKHISSRAYSLLLITLLATGCSTVDNSTRLCANDKGDFYQCNDAVFVPEDTKTESHDFQSDRSFQTINEYTEQMVYRLHQKLSKKQIAKSIIVPPFVSLSAIRSTNPHLAVDLAEAFIIDMQNIGLPAAELLVANTSTDYQADYLTYLEQSSGNDEIGYVLKGTMRKTVNGIMIYARVIEIESKQVIASTAKLLPFYLIN